jgi:archaellum component FlaC
VEVTDDRAEIMLELLRRIRSEQQEMHIEIQELKTRATSVDEHLSGLIISMSGVHSRMDRFDERLKRIERRLDLTDAK